MPERLKTQVKICGLSDRVSIASAIEGGASHIGFIFFEKSPRNITPELAHDLSREIPEVLQRVAVSVNADNEVLDEIVGTMAPDMLQLHGSETIERVDEIKRRYQLPVMKAFAIRAKIDFDKAAEYTRIADRLLFDAKPPAGSQFPGGNGVSFDWNLFSNWQQAHNDVRPAPIANNQLDSPLPAMLSGGINLNNIDEALRSSNAQAIDISSGVEKAPGIKDPELIRLLLERVKQFELDKEIR